MCTLCRYCAPDLMRLNYNIGRVDMSTAASAEITFPMVADRFCPRICNIYSNITFRNMTNKYFLSNQMSTPSKLT